MAATFGFLAQLATTTLTTFASTTVPTSKIRRFDVRACNIGAADAYVDLIVTNGTIVSNRIKNYPVPYGQAGSAPDLESGMVLPAGFYLQIKASALNSVDVSVQFAEDAA